MNLSDIDPSVIKAHIQARRDFWYFVTEILGYKKNDIYAEYKDLTPRHKDMCDRFQNGKTKRKMFLAPRYSIKSGIITVAGSLWHMVRDPNVRILIYSDSAGKASGFLTDIKNHIEGRAPNSRFREFYPCWETDAHKGKWNESQIIISKRDIDLREPTVDTGGIETSKVGMHYDIMIFDDIVSDINTTTKAQMDKVHDCYKKSLSLLKPGGLVILVGTRWNYGDCYGRIIDENRSKQNFDIFIADAEETLPDGTLVYEAIGLDRSFLDYQKSEQGSYFYSCLYRQSPSDDTTALFKERDFRFYTPRPGFHDNLFITGACDPAGEGEDFTAITVVGTDIDRNMYILDAINAHLTMNEIIAHIIRLNYKWGFDKFAVERNFFRGTLESQFRIAEEEHIRNPHYKLFSFSEDIIASSKQRNFNRVLSLQPVHECHKLFFPSPLGQSFSPGQSSNGQSLDEEMAASGITVNRLEKVYNELAFQMMQFTIDGSKSPHDDLIISLAFHVQIRQKGGDTPVDEIPVNSPAWLERQHIESLNRAQRRVPRSARHLYMPSLS